jgi:sigma-B regulation protein RsbU (phosphoserine phosphatase)
MRYLLEQAGLVVAWCAPAALNLDDAVTHDLVIVDGTSRDDESLQVCRRLRIRLSDRLLPILFVSSNHTPAARLSGLESGADTTFLRPFIPEEFVGQVQALLRIKEIHDRQTRKAKEFHSVNKCLEQTYQQISQELELARRIQQSMLPRQLPQMPPLRFAVHYRPCGRVGGDFYDIFRLDEHHVGFYVADVMGHGVPASLLTIFLKKAVRTKEITGRDYRLFAPDEVLQHLNREMLDQALAESPFITMIYGLFDRRDNRLSFARAGHPHPLYLPRSAPTEVWSVHGTLLGVFDTHFTVQSHRLLPGDKVLFYTDGLDVLGDENNSSTTQRLLELAEKCRQLPVADFVARLSGDLFTHPGQPDDMTLLGLEVAPNPN